MAPLFNPLFIYFSLLGQIKRYPQNMCIHLLCDQLQEMNCIQNFWVSLYKPSVDCQDQLTNRYNIFKAFS